MSVDGSGCVTSGPGMSTHIIASFLLLLYLQALLWLAVLLLPYTGRFLRKTGVVNYTRQHKLWTEATGVIAREELSARSCVPSRSLDRDTCRQYSYLPEAPNITANALNAEAEVLFDPKRASWKDLARRSWKVLTYPTFRKRSPENRNRLLALVKWDGYAFVVFTLILASLILSAMFLEERLDASALRKHRCADEDVCYPVRSWPVSRWLWIAWHLLLGDGIHSWRVKISFQISKLLFSLSAAPFLPLTISMINQVTSNNFLALCSASRSDSHLRCVSVCAHNAAVHARRCDSIHEGCASDIFG